MLADRRGVRHSSCNHSWVATYRVEAIEIGEFGGGSLEHPRLGPQLAGTPVARPRPGSAELHRATRCALRGVREPSRGAARVAL